jgi:D-sedoheptulose 7-phosphate isomerase
MTTEAKELAEQRIRESAEVVSALLDATLIADAVRAADVIAGALRGGSKLLVFGNGGSAADATHLAAEFVGRFLVDRRALPALSLSDNASAVTAIANDYGYERVFARQIEALGDGGDVVLAISTSGRSANVLAGVEAARARGLATIGLTGGDGGTLASLVDICLTVPSDSTPRIQEGHTVIVHVLCELAERAIG